MGPSSKGRGGKEWGKEGEGKGRKGGRGREGGEGRENEGK